MVGHKEGKGYHPSSMLTCLRQLSELLMKNPSLGTTCSRRCMWAFSLKCTDPTPLPTPPITLLSPLEGNTSRQVCVMSTLGSTCMVSMETSTLGTDPARNKKTLSSLPRRRWVTPPRSAALTSPTPPRRGVVRPYASKAIETHCLVDRPQSPPYLPFHRRAYLPLPR